MNFELKGKLIVKNDVQQVTATFQKREFVVECEENNAGRVFTDYIKFQLIQDKCSILDQYNIGDVINITFNIKGNKWEKEGVTNYFTNLSAWRIEGASTAHVDPFADEAAAQAQAEAAMYGGGSAAKVETKSDDLPF